MKPGLKERVKRGELTADRAMNLLLEKARRAGDEEYVTSTRTWRWLWNFGGRA